MSGTVNLLNEKARERETRIYLYIIASSTLACTNLSNVVVGHNLLSQCLVDKLESTVTSGI